ncbi:YggS family pyridoxal phosphate-dependent enzyme [Thiorhodococcus mannitoliphagus]|uniref:Pyridoxal phosphate homeostasis protein n=1 Tax=Thiorhodococcus mannitoliphagus TaxID=329406 RepID=A0A6P1DS60_9GAMM|nr:YggS family pyridoxal phosphate-dependent enzyme [Thiorhodococcus mannitoliphagus]NEX18832.1 YggS family pyridoxal phosphate-dependent enzyme [Thiorhodococcus mannitoliphagus]
MTDASVASRLEQVLERIRSAAARAGRSPEEITLIAVSKKQPVDAIRAAYGAGQRVFGESYVQEGLDKIAALRGLDIEWHFIGRIQSNKTRQIAASFAWVHGLSDLGHARRLNDQRPPEAPPLKVCLQVNLSGERSKAGVDPADLADLLAACSVLPRLEVRGLMTLPAPAEDEAGQRKPLASLRRLRDQLATAAHPLSCLSMGMSGDLEAAILEGATQVRIGTAVFGPRPYN